MKANQIIKLALVLYAGSCMGKTPVDTDKKPGDTPIIAHTPGLSAPVSFPAGKIIDSVFCKAAPTHSYALYIPTKGNGEPLPVIYFFDPHGSGAYPLNKYKSLADAYGFIIIGSNNSKNGNNWSTTENIWQLLSEDAQIRLKINPNRIYTCGFSGGAKVAAYVALQHAEVKGVIAGGAGLPDGTPASDFTFSFTAIAGEGDLNLTDLLAIGNDLDKTHTRHHLILFDGKHEWAPLNSMNTAFEGLQLDAMQQGLIPRNEALVDRYISTSKKKLEACIHANELVKAVDECKRFISYLDGLMDQAEWFKMKAASLVNTPLYLQQREAQENMLVTEQNIKKGYMQRLQQQDMPWWTKTISDLQSGAQAKTAHGAMYQRLLAWLSLAFYSYSNHLLNSNANSEAGYFVALYKMADPTNSEAWYFSAILHARETQAQAAENDLIKAVEYGFRDSSRMVQQPEFQPLSGQIHFSRIENGMHASLPE